MKRQPIQNPKLYGCATCGTIPGVILTDSKTFYPGFPHILTIQIDDFSQEIQETEDGINVDGINEMFENRLINCQFAELHHETPLHDETYEYNPDDGKWYLVEQGQGYA